LPITPNQFVVFPLHEEAYIEHAVKLIFDASTMKFIESKPLTPMPKRMMRPTPVFAKLSHKMGGENILMIGGNEQRESFAYSIA
jgi:hypothetical protein